jgi:hypothetical protein
MFAIPYHKVPKVINQSLLLTKQNEHQMSMSDGVKKERTPLEVWLSFISALVWPLLLAITLIVFKSDIQNLLGKVRSSEIAGAKFTFEQTANGYILDKLDEIVKEKSEVGRKLIAERMRETSDVIGSIPPKSFGYFITGVGEHFWGKSIYESDKKYFDYLVNSKLVIVEKEKEVSSSRVRLTYTNKGRFLLKQIGFSDDDMKHAKFVEN